MKKSKYILMILAAGIFSNCADKEKDAQPKGTENFCLKENFKEKVTLESVKKEKVLENIHLTGNVEADPNKVFQFESLVNGMVVNTHFSLGDEVTKGQVLAELKSSELSSLQAELATLNAQIKVFERRLRSTEELFNDGVSSERDVLEVQSELESLKAEKEKVGNNLELYSASTQKGVFLIKAPASGHITSKSINKGEQISDDSGVLFTISEVDHVWVMANVYATNINEIKTGMKVQISSVSYPDLSFDGTISLIPKVLDEETKVMKARIILDNANGFLKPGMLVDIIAQKQLDASEVALTTKDVVFSNNEYFVLVYQSDCDVEIRKVEILASNDETLYIKNGIKEREQIISGNQLLVFEQLKNF
ncbi:efflux RND transporter periplasmic adaptor subunit [Maribacter luteus]|uniref:Efflux RND transporter periplasmic adaptor subunit n=1 Tax=Maribacter luteus TaxID=2594478 RepID=A0A6I2MQV4_9FLAO|nr:efflux RND transporter periplasmic adaptor subunit [Maribacter luteus]MRX66241.1 efflux RND transporter periplasmic adaptor subunit [Maribacter luteus]